MSFKLCSVGCGGLSNRAHGPSYRLYADAHDDVELLACCDIDAERAAAYREKFGFARSYTDYREMLTSEKPDAVCLMAPVWLTCEMSCAILEMGFPLLLEKPPGLTGEECRRMIAAAEAGDVPNQVAFNRRHCPLIKRAKAELKNFTPEQIQDIRYDFFRVGRRDQDFSTTAIHGIDTVKFLAGADYQNIRFTYREFPELGPTVANIFMECTFTSGTTAHLNFAPNTGAIIERATICLLDEVLFLNAPIWGAYDSPGRLTHVRRGEVVSDVFGDEICDAEKMYINSGFFGENESFLDDIRAGRKPVDDIVSGLQSVEIADCIRHRLPEYSRPG